MKNFEWVDHTADVGFKAYGKDLKESFENAALALSEIITNTEDVEAKKRVLVKVEAEDLEALLFDWLDYFLYLFDAESFIGSKFEIEKFSEKDEGYSISAEVGGEEFDQGKHKMGTEVKAITYHMMEINRSEEQCSVQVIVDI